MMQIDILLKTEWTEALDLILHTDDFGHFYSSKIANQNIEKLIDISLT